VCLSRWPPTCLFRYMYSCMVNEVYVGYFGTITCHSATMLPHRQGCGSCTTIAPTKVRHSIRAFEF
jgi:hypothetical protein